MNARIQLKARILVVEDDLTIRTGLIDNFKAQGWTVKAVADGEQGLQQAYDWPADLIVLDIMLPGINGYEICNCVRKEGIDTPILMLTAKGQTEDVVRGLELGADDYLIKPFSLAVLLARARALLRRVVSTQNQYTFSDGYELDLSTRQLSHFGQSVTLTPKEFDLLAYFLASNSCALSRSKIISKVWGNGLFVTDRSVDRCVKTLRSKLTPQAADQIQTIRSIGYRWDDA